MDPVEPDEIIPALEHETHQRREARALESRLRWGVTPEMRQKVLEKLGEALDNPKVKTRTRVTVIRCISELNRQDQADQHHLEGQKVNLTATISKAPDVEAMELVAEFRRGDLTPRAN